MSAEFEFVILAAGEFKERFGDQICPEAEHICLCCCRDDIILASACIRPGPDGWVAYAFLYHEDVAGSEACKALLQKLFWYSVSISVARPNVFISLAMCAGYDIVRNAAPGVRAAAVRYLRGRSNSMPGTWPRMPRRAAESKTGPCAAADLNVVTLSGYDEGMVMFARRMAAEMGYPRCADEFDEIGLRKVICFAFRGERSIGCAVVARYPNGEHGGRDMFGHSYVEMIESKPSDTPMLFAALRQCMDIRIRGRFADAARMISAGRNILQCGKEEESNEIAAEFGLAAPRGRRASI